MKQPRHPKLEQFLTNLAYCTLSEPGFYEICAASGIDWSWPKTFAGEAVLEFVKHGGLVDRDKALPKVRSLISILESQVTKLSEIPTSIEGIRSSYRELTKVQRALDVAANIIRDPESYERWIQTLEVHGGNDVVTYDQDALISNYSIVYEEIRAGKAVTPLPGFPGLTAVMGGINPGRITVILGWSGFGKTNLGMNMAFAATQRMDVGYMNMEMSFDDVSKRAAVILSGETWDALLTGNIHPDRVQRHGRYELQITDGRELHVESIMAWCRGYKRTNPDFGLLVIDYDQKMDLTTTKETPEWRAMQMAFRRLEDLAKAINIHVIVMAQVNDEGRISSSQRATFTASTVLTFRRHNGEAVIENSVKHRHARGPRAVPVRYDGQSATVMEAGDPFDISSDAESVDRGEARKASLTKIRKAATTGFKPYKED